MAQVWDHLRMSGHVTPARIARVSATVVALALVVYLAVVALRGGPRRGWVISAGRARSGPSWSFSERSRRRAS